MAYNPDIHHRRSIRLKEYDYSLEGMYCITICVNNRECLFGEIVNEEMVLNESGCMAKKVWLSLPERFPEIRVDEFIIMPNHMHGIIIIDRENVGAIPCGCPETGRAGTRPAPTKIGNVIGAFKSLTTNEYIRNVHQNNWKPFEKKLWQRNYYEQIIRNEEELNRIREYIVNNPISWEKDNENPNNTRRNRNERVFNY